MQTHNDRTSCKCICKYYEEIVTTAAASIPLTAAHPDQIRNNRLLPRNIITNTFSHVQLCVIQNVGVLQMYNNILLTIRFTNYVETVLEYCLAQNTIIANKTCRVMLGYIYIFIILSFKFYVFQYKYV